MAAMPVAPVRKATAARVGHGQGTNRMRTAAIEILARRIGALGVAALLLPAAAGPDGTRPPSGKPLADGARPPAERQDRSTEARDETGLFAPVPRDLGAGAGEDASGSNHLFATVPRALTATASPKNAQAAKPADRIARKQEKVRVLQAEGGAYARGLTDALLELGEAYRAADQHKGAATAFKEALHVARVNHGLHDLRQLPYLKRLIEENAELGRWKKVIDNYHYLYWIHKRNYGEKDPRLLPVIERVAMAELSIHKSTPLKTISKNLEKNRRLLQEAVEIIELHYGNDPDRMAEALYRVALSNYGIALQTGKLIHYRRYKEHSRGGRTAFIDEELGKVFQLIKRTESDGRAALDRIEELYEEKAPGKTAPRALAAVRLGDWRQLYGNGSGRRYYEDAYALLKETEDGEERIARLFGEPQLLPAMDVWTEGGSGRKSADAAGKADTGQGKVVTFAFDVSASGEVRDVEPREVPESLGERAEKLQRYIELLRFRPRMKAGEPVSTRMTRAFLITDKGRILRLDDAAERIETAETTEVGEG